MKPYVVYDKQGNIIETGFTTQAHIDELRAGGMNVLIGQGTTTAHYVDVATATVCQKRAARVGLVDSRVEQGEQFRLTIPYKVNDARVEVTSPKGAKSAFAFSGSEFIIDADEIGFYQVLVVHPSLFTAALALHAIAPLSRAA